MKPPEMLPGWEKRMEDVIALSERLFGKTKRIEPKKFNWPWKSKKPVIRVMADVGEQNDG